MSRSDFGLDLVLLVSMVVSFQRGNFLESFKLLALRDCFAVCLRLLKSVQLSIARPGATFSNSATVANISFVVPSYGVLNRLLGCLLRFDVDIVVIMSNMYTRLSVPLRPYLPMETPFIHSRSRFGASILPAANTD